MDGYEPSLRPNLNGYDAFDTKAVEVRGSTIFGIVQGTTPRIHTYGQMGLSFSFRGWQFEPVDEVKPSC